MGTLVMVNYILGDYVVSAVVIVYTKLWPNKRQWRPRCRGVCPCCSKFFPERTIAPLSEPTDIGVENGAQAKKNVMKAKDQVEGLRLAM